MVRKLSIRSALEKERIEEVARLICEGKVAVIPTDTVYGLATNPFREEFVARIFEIKRRGKKPIPLLVSSREYVERVAFLTPQAERLMGRFWPGPLTMVLKRRPETPPIITCESPGVGVRMPAHDVALAIVEKAGGVVTGTSANISGERPPASVSEISPEIVRSVDVIVDSGGLGGTPSTVIDLTKDPPVLVRRGPIDVEILSSVLGIRIEH